MNPEQIYLQRNKWLHKQWERIWPTIYCQISTISHKFTALLRSAELRTVSGFLVIISLQETDFQSWGQFAQGQAERCFCRYWFHSWFEKKNKLSKIYWYFSYHCRDIINTNWSSFDNLECCILGSYYVISIVEHQRHRFEPDRDWLKRFLTSIRTWTCFPNIFLIDFSFESVSLWIDLFVLLNCPIMNWKV